MKEPAATLLIDDEPIFAPPLVDAFEAAGLALDVVATWEEGIDRFIVVNYELVIADFDLQESRTGLLLLGEIRKMAPSTRLILVSGRIDQAGRALVVEAGVADIYIEKSDPALRRTLLDEGRQAFERAQKSGWVAAARALPRADDVDMERIEALQAELQTHHSRRGQ